VVEGRTLVAGFNGGTITSDGGALLLGAVNRAVGLIDRLSACFKDGRDQNAIEHSLPTLIGQRVLGLALGYEDLNDHDQIRHDPLLAAILGKLTSRNPRCAALAGKSTLNRLEHAPATDAITSDRYHKITYDAAAIENLFVDLFLDAHTEAPKQIILDLDATDDPIHGNQEGAFFHGYYDSYCYLPLYIFCGRHLLVSKLRPANIDGAAGAVAEVSRLVTRIRARWPDVQIILRADSGFARDELMTWCEVNAVDYLFGLAKTSRLITAIADEMAEANAEAEATGKPARRFKDMMWRTRKSWSRERRVVAKAERIKDKDNPRFVVTTLSRDVYVARDLYEKTYCERGEMENRIKECQLDLFADRTSTESFKANQLRLWLASMAYVLVSSVRRLALTGTQFANATCGTIRLKLLKIGAQVTISVRRVAIALTSAYPHKDEFRAALARLS
jgi:hypothetical protein